MTTTVQTLPDALEEEITRCVELVGVYKALPGGVGGWGAIVIQWEIDRGKEALAAWDAVAMIRALTKLRECQ